MRFSNPNRCDEVTRALAAPGAAGPGPEDLAEHLAACPACAARAEQDAALGRLWEATRPVEPTGAAWDALWARVSDRLDAAEAAPAVVAFPARPRGRAAVHLFIVAQAAALLAAVTLALAHRPGSDGPRPDAALTASAGAEAGLPEPGDGRDVRVVIARDTIVIDPGEIVVIREDEQGLHPVELVLDDRSNTLDGYYALYNAFESMADYNPFDAFAE